MKSYWDGPKVDFGKKENGKRNFFNFNLRNGKSPLPYGQSISSVETIIAARAHYLYMSIIHQWAS